MSNEYCSPEVRQALYERAGGFCECTMNNCHPQVFPNARCFMPLVQGNWDAHRRIAGGQYQLWNLVAMCKECHQHTPSYGVGR